MTHFNGAPTLAPDDLKEEELYPIREVSRLTGVNPVTLRAWERRYGLIQPVRTPSGHRLYSRSNIEAVRQILAWTERGVAVSKVGSILARVEPAEPSAPALAPARSHDEWQDWQAQVRHAVSQFDEWKLERLYGQLLNVFPVAGAFTGVLMPVWQDALTHQDVFGHASEWLFLDAFLRSRCLARLHLAQHQGDELVMLAPIPEQCRELELLVAGLLLCSDSASVRVMPLGQPLNELALIAQKIGPQALVLYSDHAPSADLKRTLGRLTLGLDCPVALAGEVSELAADSLAGSAIACLGRTGPASARRLAQLLDGRLDT